MSELKYPKGSTERRTLIALKRGPLTLSALGLVLGNYSHHYELAVSVGNLIDAGMVRKLYGPVRYELTEDGKAEANQ